MALTKILQEGIKDGEILNADINASAAIAASKLAKPVDLADNEKIRLGTGNDIEIYHDGTHSRIKHSGSGTQELLLSGNIISLNNTASNEYMLKATENGSVDLYYNNLSLIHI